MGSKAFSIYQGDALQITCSVTNNNGEVLNLTNYDGIHFTVKTNKESPTLIIHKTLGAGITVVSAAKGQLKVTLLNDDSKEIEPGLYYYEIMLEDTSEDLQYVVVQDFVKVIGRVLGYPESVPGNFIVMGNFQVGVDDGLARTAKFFADVTVGSPTNPRTFTKYGSANIIGAVDDDYALRLQHNSSAKPVLLIRNAANDADLLKIQEDTGFTLNMALGLKNIILNPVTGDALKINLPAGITGLYIDGETIPHLNAYPTFKIDYARGDNTSHYAGGALNINYKIAGTNSAWGSAIGVLINDQHTSGMAQAFGLFVGNHPSWNCQSTTTINGVWINFGERNVFTAGSRVPTLYGVRCDIIIPSTVGGTSVSSISGGQINITVQKENYMRQPRGWSSFNRYQANQYQPSSEYVSFYAGIQIDTGISLNWAGNYIGPNGLKFYTASLNMYDATCVINQNFICYSFAAVSPGGSNFRGTINGNFETFNTTFESGVTGFIAVNLRHSMAQWDISAITLSGYAAAYDGYINANGRTFPVYGTKFDIDGTMGAGAVWRGHYIDASGVVCGSGQTFYGLHYFFTGIGTGGTILGAKFEGCSVQVMGDGQYIQVPVMASGSKPGTPGKGMIIFNDTSGKGEMYDGSTWQSMW